MRLLLDTHVFIWSVDDDPKLSADAWSMIQSAELVFVSAASLWEATIKFQLGKLSIAPSLLAAAIEPSGFTALPIRVNHAVAISRLPPIHRDPFDRLLIAQAITEPLHFLTADAQLEQYSELVRRF